MFLEGFFVSLFIHNFFIHYFVSWKIFFLFVVFYVVKERRGLWKIATEDASSRIGLLVVLYSFLVTLWVPYKTRHFVLSIALAVAFLVYITILYYDTEIKKKIAEINGSLFLLFILSLLVYLYNIVVYTPLELHQFWASASGTRQILANSHISFTYVGIDLLPRLSGFHLGPNLFSLYCGIALLMGVWGFRRKKSWTSLGLILVSSISLVLTLSRGGILSMAFSLILATMVLSLKKRNVRPLLIYSVLTLLVVVLVFFLMPDLRHIVEVRFSSIWNGSEPRFRYWGDYVLFIGKFFGWGFGFGEKIFGFYAHNTYLSVLIGLGILGLAVFLFLFSFHIVASFRSSEFESLSMLFFIFLLGFTLDLQFEVGFWIGLALVRIFSEDSNEHLVNSS